MRHIARRIMVQLVILILLLMCMPISGSSSDAQGNDVALGCG
jgi:hypothetical protein